MYACISAHACMLIRGDDAVQVLVRLVQMCASQCHSTSAFACEPKAHLYACVCFGGWTGGLQGGSHRCKFFDSYLTECVAPGDLVTQSSMSRECYDPWVQQGN